jgi:DNA-binding NtrC family response regulator
MFVGKDVARGIMSRYQTLLVEDDPIFQEQVVRTLSGQHQLSCARTLEEGSALIRKKPFDIVLLDKFLKDGLGTTLIPEIRARLPQAVIIMVTADKTDESIFEALNAGASDYLPKGPALTTDLTARIQVAIGRLGLERRLKRVETLAQDKLSPELVGSSEPMRELRKLISQLAGNRINILVSGESGTGKELIARALNSAEGDPSRHFVAVNCGAIPEPLVESELFGHVRGAFTGALSDKPGKFELANGGDLFLDEVGELSPPTQVKLLRVLQEGEFSRVGCNTIRYSKPRIISATNRDLAHMIENKLFREDLFYRINAFEIRTISLRERREDIPGLIDHFLQSAEGPKFSVHPDATDLLVKRQWPGNIRELKNAVDCAIVFAKARRSYQLEVRDFSQTGQALAAETLARSPSMPGLRRKFTFARGEYKSFLEEAERTYLLSALESHQWDAEAVARSIGVSRSTLYHRMVAFSIKRPRGATISRDVR